MIILSTTVEIHKYPSINKWITFHYSLACLHCREYTIEIKINKYTNLP
jgi:hypothetical protein